MIDSNIKEMLQYAYEHVSHYKEMLPMSNIDLRSINTVEDFRKLPLLSKNTVINDPKSFIADEYNFFPKNNNLSIRRTSGSTGKYLKVYWDNIDNVRSLTGLWLMRKKHYNILPNDKHCYFFTTEYIRNKFVITSEDRYSPTHRSIGFTKLNLNQDRLIDICKTIYEFSPKWLLLQPSLARLLADCFVENSLPVPKSIEYIEMTGELLLDDNRAYIKNVFNCRVANQYGCNEANSIAMECEHGNMHCMSSNVLVEIIKDGEPVADGEEGDIYITTLINHAMPFIRYKTGDRGKMVNEQCACGNNNPILKLTKGRESEYITTENNEKINPYVFLFPIETINEKIGNIIKQFQITQTGINEFSVKLAIMKSYASWSNEVAKIFKENMQEPQLQNAHFEFDFTNILLPDEKSGKLAFFYNNVKGE